MPGSKHSLEYFSPSAATTGDSTIAAAKPGKLIYVISVVLIASVASAAPSFKSGTTTIVGPLALAINGGFALSAPGDDSWLFRTAPNEALIYNQAVDGCDGFVTYYYG